MTQINIIGVLILGSGICLIPLLLYSKEEKNKRFFNYLTLVEFFFFLVLGFYLIISSLVLNVKSIAYSSVGAFFFSTLSFSIYITIKNDNNKILNQPTRNRRGHFYLLGLGGFSITISLVLKTLYSINVNIDRNYFKFISNPFFIGFLSFLSLLFLLFILFGRIDIISTKKRFSISVSFSKNKKVFFVLIFLSFFFISFLVNYLSNFNPYTGQVDEDPLAKGGDALSVLYWTIMGSGPFIGVTSLVLIGALAKMVAQTEASKKIGNVLILWLPAFTWVLVFVGVIPVPDGIITLFGGIQFLAYMLYLLIYGSLMLGISAAVSIFYRFKEG